ncbi:holo-ACP synthase [Paenactinomyces guangxiensis]|uniref:Holo-[acyl-carrier-protein] synthase n=1 Tax=Paenactinomyces guangxiensis TaxID=1490290 RepID=A0A7W1WTZ9_9BACL|nr:holo-ACP synthase [Paenactinomyces guangxiensis]MBA4496014.1 holo-ACP synthase [Paenactinomyces guangxiensis]MBH8593110.1 holo-ACP synthase [Paenactinomyces guangxiensis]
MIKGIGTDIVEIKRIEEMGIERLARRILTEKERNLLPERERRRLEYIAGRFAAKEAISKALGTGIGQCVSFTDLEIVNVEKGTPRAVLSASAQQRLFGGSRIHIHLSISHSDHYATAMSIVEEMKD